MALGPTPFHHFSKNYGFWLDTNMEIDDFENSSVSKELFESKWNEFF